MAFISSRQSPVAKLRRGQAWNSPHWGPKAPYVVKAIDYSLYFRASHTGVRIIRVTQ